MLLFKYEKLGLPREKGGWNIPSAVVLADTCALKTTLHENIPQGNSRPTSSGFKAACSYRPSSLV